MCERFIIVESSGIIETRFNVHAGPIQIEKNYNLSPNQDAPIITCEDNRHV